jgi:hypothetical protein
MGGEKTMGAFKDAVAASRKAATKEQEQQKAAADAKAATAKADIEAAKKWLEEDVRPVVNAANDDLKEEKLGIVWEANPGENNPSVKLDFRIMNTPGGHPTGRSIGLTVFPGGKVKAYRDHGQGTDLGTITTVGSDKIQKLLIKILQEIGAQHR